MVPWESADIGPVILLSIAIGLIGEPADPIKRGNASSAPTIRTAKAMRERAPFKWTRGVEGDMFLIRIFSLRPDSAHVSCEETRTIGPDLEAEELIAGNGLRKLLAVGFSLKRLGHYDRQISRSLVSMTTCMEWTSGNTVHLVERGGSRLTIKKAGMFVEHFASNVKLQFDDIFVSTIPQEKS